MDFQAISVEHPKARVLGKLRKGGRVRIMCGSGMNLMVHSSRYNHITKSFNKGKAYTLELTPEELQANMSSQGGGMEGRGLFDSIKGAFQSFGDKLKAGGQATYDAFKPIANTFRPVINEGVNQLAASAPEMGASALSGLALFAGQPELVPYAAAAGSQLGSYIGNRGKQQYYGSPAPAPAPPSRGVEPPSRVVASNILSSPVGVSNLGTYLASLSLADLDAIVAKKRQSLGVIAQTPFDYSGSKQVLAPYTDAVGQGLYASGRGGHGKGVSVRKSARTMERSSVGIHGNLLGFGLPPALKSQPYSANFQFASRLPPAYKSLNSGAGLYA